ncbi:hypothetical protein KIPB_012802, partial [Kipferlia bialata]
EHVSTTYSGLVAEHRELCEEVTRMRGSLKAAKLQREREQRDIMEREGALVTQISEAREILKARNHAVSVALAREQICKEKLRASEATAAEAQTSMRESQARFEKYAKLSEKYIKKLKKKLAQTRQEV